MHKARSARRFLSLGLMTAMTLVFSSCKTVGGYSNTSSTTTPAAVTVGVSSPTTIAAGVSATFTATVQNTTNTAVTWQVNGTTGGNSTVGTISTAGSFTAPTLPTAPYNGFGVVITAVLQADPTKSNSIGVTIQYANASIQGAYAFFVSGGIANATVSAVGTFQADGKGSITNGFEDFNGSVGVFPNVTLTGSYSVGSDGRGTATITSSLGTTNYRFVIGTSGELQLIGFDSAESINGFATPQDSTSLSLSAIAGNWSFFLSGSSSGKTVVDAGRFSLDSAGNITQGVEDYNNGGTVTSSATFTGNATSLSATGRGTASFTGTLGTSRFAFYVDSANTVYFVETDSGVFLTGSAYKQQSATFANSSLSGSYVFLLAGADNLGRPAAEIGEINADGNGNITSGVFDENDNGTVALNQAITGGSYAVASNGRGTAMALSVRGTSSYAFYLVSQNLVVFVETDSFGVTEGLANLQIGPYSVSSISGSLGFASFGVVTSGGFESVGRMTASGSGSLTTGVEDVAQAGTVVSGIALTGAYSLGSNGRGTALLTGGGGTSNLIFYVFASAAAPVPAFAYLEVDPSEVIAGFAAKQFETYFPWDY
jgi:hypothetical protein